MYLVHISYAVRGPSIHSTRLYLLCSIMHVHVLTCIYGPVPFTSVEAHCQQGTKLQSKSCATIRPYSNVTIRPLLSVTIRPMLVFKYKYSSLTIHVMCYCYNAIFGAVLIHAFIVTTHP